MLIFSSILNFMIFILKLEELAKLCLGIFAFYFLDFSWWWFIGLFFAPDIGAIGYVFNAKIGAFLYNLFHHQGLAILFWGIGFYLHLQVLQLIGAIGYVFNAKIGAFLYNLFHHQGVAILFWIIGFHLQLQVFQLIGVILFSHSAFDRILGYGLKYEKGFKFTHLGEIGK